MPLRISTIWGLLALILPFVTASHWSRRHQEVAHRARGDVDLHKRQTYYNARFTFYDVGLGACGQYNVASDWIVALNVEQYGGGYPGPYCFQSITIQYNGKTAQAVIMDECMGCMYAALDFSRGLFDYFAPESEGVIYGTWWFDNGAPADTTSSTPAYTPPAYTPPATTSTPDYTPSSTTPDYTPPPPPTTTSTPAYTPPPTTTTTSTTTSTTSLSTTPTSSATTHSFTSGINTSSAVPTGGVTSNSNNPQNLFVINNILIEVGIALSAAEKGA